MDDDMEEAFSGGENGGGGAAVDFLSLEVDFDYEFDASRYFDFSRPESPLEAREAELWFDCVGSYPPSPFIAKINIGANILGDNVNILPKFKDAEETSHVVAYSDIGSCKELAATEETNSGMNINTEMYNDLLKVDVKPATKLPFSRGSTLMKPTVCHLAKQNHSKNIKSSTGNFHRSQKPSTRDIEKSCKGTCDNTSQASKRQKLDDGRSRKVHNVKEQMLLVHKISQKKEEHSDCNPGFPRLKLTIPREPELGTARRAQRTRPGRSIDVEVNAASTAKVFRARPLNRKILEAPSFPIPQKSMPRLPEFQEFHLKTSERAMQHAFASSSQVQDLVASSHVQDVAIGSEGQPLHASDPHTIQKLNSNDDHHQEECKKELLKFKARPFNKKILSGKGDMGVFRSNKREITRPLGFNFKTEKRCQQNLPIELFNKLSLTSEGQQSNTSDTKISYAMHGSKENIAEHGQQDDKAIHVSKVDQHAIGKRQLKCEQDVVATSLRHRPNLCRSMRIR